MLQRYADLPMDLADASLVLLAEALGHGRILTTDERDFRTYRWKSRAPFENLLATYTKRDPALNGVQVAARPAGRTRQR